MTRFALAILAILLPGSAVAQPGGPSAQAIFRKVVLAQGSLRAGDVRDVILSFRGEIAEEGQTNTVHRTYWYRVKDGSFRIRTGSSATDKVTTDRGILGPRDFWEKNSKGKLVRLRSGNRDDAESIKSIRRERRDFKRILRMVLLTRMDDGEWRISFAEPRPVKLERDYPFERKGTLGDRSAITYHVLDAVRAGEPRLRLYVHTKDLTVQKVVQYRVEAPDEVEWVYYFGPFRRHAALDLNLPRYFSAYSQTPVDRKSRDAYLSVKGEPEVKLNLGLRDADLKPSGK